nr:hypothetical protein [Tanacetum cinerariifolium]
MVAYLSKSDASEGFTQIIDFLNGSYIKYALTVNPNIYVSCIKKFWTTVAVKQVNDITRLQALVDKKKVVVTEATIREALRLDDAEGVDSFPNKKFFAELARMGYEKPSTKLTFYKAFFSSQWNLVRNVDSASKFCMYPRFLQLMIRKQVGNLSTHTTKYTSPALTQKVFANMRRVGKGFSRVETPLFESMLVEQQVAKEGDANENDETINAGDAAEGDVSAAHGEVSTVDKEPSIPSPTPPTPPPQPTQDIPSTSQVQPTPPQSPQVQPLSPQPQPPQDAEFPMNLLQEVMDTCATLTRRVEHLEFDKVTQALEITKLKRRVKKLERRNKVRKLKFQRLQRVGTSQRVETSDETMLDDVSNQGRMIAEMDQDDAVVLEDDKEEDKEVADAVKDVKEAKEPKPLKKKQQIEQDEQYARELQAELNKNIDWDETIDHVKRKAKEDPAVKRYQVLKRKPQTKAQAKKNMMMYLKNVAGFKMDYFKGMSYDDIRPIFEGKFNLNVAFLLKTKEQIEEDENRALKRLSETPTERPAKRQKLNEEVEELKRHLQIMPNEDDDVYIEATPLAQKVPLVDYQIIELNNKPYYKIIRADDTHQLYVGEMNALSNQVTSNSISSYQESNVMKNDNVLFLGIFSMNPFKAFMVDKFVPNKHVKASIRTKPITVSQPHVITTNNVNSKTNGFSPKDIKSATKTRRPLPKNNPKNDKVPSKSKSSRLSNNLEKIEENHKNLQSSSNQKHMPSECNNIKLAIRNAQSKVVCAMCGQNWFDTLLILLLLEYKPKDKEDHEDNEFYSVICSTNNSNGEHQVVSKSFAVTTADASDKRQQQQDSTSSTLTLATTITADGNFDL